MCVITDIQFAIQTQVIKHGGCSNHVGMRIHLFSCFL